MSDDFRLISAFLFFLSISFAVDYKVAMLARIKYRPFDLTILNHVMTAFRLKVGFHYPSSRAEFTGRVDGPRTRVHFLTPVNSGRELGQWKQDARVHGPCTRASPDVR